VAATAALAGLALALCGPEARRVLVALGLLAVLLQAGAVLRGAFAWAGWSAGVLLGGYGIAVVAASAGRGLVAVAFGCGLLLACELASWSVDLARTGGEPARLGWRRAATLATLVLGSGAVAAVVVVPAELLGTPHGLAVRGAGVTAAVAVLATLAWLASRIRPHRPAADDGRARPGPRPQDLELGSSRPPPS
jgi:hypothetical protein